MKREILFTTIGLLGAAAIPAMASPYSDAITALGPSAYWPMQDAAGSGVGVDAVGNTYPLGNFNGVTQGVAGPSLPGMASNESAYSLDGVGTGANTNNTPYVPVSGTAARTEIVWANEAVSSANFAGGQFQALSEYGVALSGSTTDTDFGLNIFEGYTSNYTPLGYDTLLLSLSGRNVEGITTPINPGTWYMLAVVFPNGLTTSGQAQLYVDGVLQTNSLDIGEVPNTAPPPTSNDLPFRIGQPYGGYGYDGSESELSFFTSALSSNQIQGLYNTATGNVPEPASMSVIGVAALMSWRRRRRSH